MGNSVAIVGAGRVGSGCARILNAIGGYNLVVIDTSQDALDAVKSQVDCATHLFENEVSLIDVLKKHAVKAVICSTPFFMNVTVAKAAMSAGAHYIDFTEDVSITEQIKQMGATSTSIISQTGLAPGLISYIGLSLFDESQKPKSLSLRVGALSQLSLGPAHYSITWSPEGLINEYIRPALRKTNGAVETVSSLDYRENLIINGVRYEAFTTSGGVGDLSAYASIPTVEYKTLRYPGHLEVAKQLVTSGQTFEQMVATAKKQFPTTREDLVVMAAMAVDADNHMRSFSTIYHPYHPLNLTALELTTSGTGCAVLQLALEGALPTGFVTADMVKLELLKQTEVAKRFL